MSCVGRGTVRGISWHTGAVVPARALAPLFAANDNGDADYRALTAAAARLWRDFDADAAQVAAHRAQAAFWQGRMASCRWWHSVARAFDRALLAGHSLRVPPDRLTQIAQRNHVPSNL